MRWQTQGPLQSSFSHLATARFCNDESSAKVCLLAMDEIDAARPNLLDIMCFVILAKRNSDITLVALHFFNDDTTISYAAVPGRAISMAPCSAKRGRVNDGSTHAGQHLANSSACWRLHSL